ncbi:amidase signature enzyme [Teratosphaeria nubilosa]|uniref:Amidase signature enzyme n=1 Tax=Teratosphaeria nubilosa TaxID=161662 RepID=A0A6G1LH85_9PEZI|nr:amidase signature enzyme [Teratosphaeria nubilosa]
MDQTLELPSARPYAYRFRPESTALLLIDMQRDFLDPNGFGAIQCGNDEIFKQVANIVPRTKEVLDAARRLGLHIFHTREGHKSDLSDLPPSKRLRQVLNPNGHHSLGIGDEGPMGRLLVRGEFGHDIIDELKPHPDEVVIDKPGKGSFWNTDLHRGLLARGITHLLIAGVTTECCVNGTFREAGDRGFECCVLADCTNGFDASFVSKTLEMLCSYDGLFGFVLDSSTELLNVMNQQISSIARAPLQPEDSLTIASLQAAYRNGARPVTEVAQTVHARINDYQSKDPAVWIYRRSLEQLLNDANAIMERFAGQPLPALYGIPFAVKDNIDVATITTTAACGAYAYVPARSATVVTSLLEAGALFVGKTNLDQLATGLAGCRSPYGYPRSVYGNDRVAGGSSSGSAVAVGAGLVSFALGTDTAGSGRVPAAFNGITGFKPTKGTLSAAGVVPACKSLDTVSILASSVEEARRVWLVMDQGPDAEDIFAKPEQSLPVWHADFRGIKHSGFVFGVPPLEALQKCTDQYLEHFQSAIGRLEKSGGRRLEIDWSPFDGANRLMYAGGLLYERVQCIGPEFIQENLRNLHPSTNALFRAALERNFKPYDVYRDEHLRAQYAGKAASIFETIDVLIVPTASFHPTVAEVEFDPLDLNARLGDFTNFGNLLDLCGIAVNASFFETEAGEKLPFGVTLLGASGRDGKLFDIAKEFERTR